MCIIIPANWQTGTENSSKLRANMSRTKIVAGNWKMHKSMEEGLALITEIRGIAKDECNGRTDIVVCPPFIHLNTAVRLTDGSNVKVGAQNCHQNAEGAYTGEISAGMIKSTGAGYVILGHSERRQYFGENAELLKSKVEAALGQQLHILFCCGETLEERNNNQHFDIIKSQLEGSLGALTEAEMANITIAYEPVWAIGTGVTASPEQANEIHVFIRNWIKNHWNEQVAENCSILYGGSVKPDNAANLFSFPDIDGGLIGGAALKARDFIEIVKAMDSRS